MILDSKGFFARVCEVLRARTSPEIARKLGISKHAVYLWEKGNMPGVTHLRNLARVAESGGVSLHWLLTGKGSKAVTDRENEGDDSAVVLHPASDVAAVVKELAVEDHSTPAEAAERLLREALIERGLLREAVRDVNVVFYGGTKLAPIRVVGEIERGKISYHSHVEMERVAPEFRPIERDARALSVRGTSLSDSEIYDGDLIVFSEQTDPSSVANGSVVIASTQKGETVRTLYRVKGKATLRAHNPDVPDIVVPADKLKILGVVIGIQRKKRGLRDLRAGDLKE